MIKKIFLNNHKSKTEVILKSNYLSKYLRELNKVNQKNYFIVDSKVKYILKEDIKNNKNTFIFVNGNESLKSFKNYSNLTEKLISKKIDRDSNLIAIGGGTVGDICGFIASTVLRGVNFILIPTTLLSQVDSSIGGKNGINTSEGKNLIGTFYQPNKVIIDPKILYTLSKREIKCGYSEIVKHSLIYDKKFFLWLNENFRKILQLNLKSLEEAIYKSILIKSVFINNDYKEKLLNSKSRAMLNFGHSFGHALETYYKYKKKLNHGEAISIGMIIEAKLSNILGYLSNAEVKKIEKHFLDSGLKVYDESIKSTKIINILIKDKKNVNNKINIVLLKKIGVSFYARAISINKIKELLRKL